MSVLKILMMVFAALTISGCARDTYQPFLQGQIVHHVADGMRGVVVTCSPTRCSVATSGKRYQNSLWMIYEIAETPAPRTTTQEK